MKELVIMYHWCHKTCNNGCLMVVQGWNLFIYDVFFNDFTHFLRFSLIFINMQIRLFAYLTIWSKACV